MNKKTVDIKTKDGICDTYVSYPESTKNLPIVIIFMDAIGLRQRIYDMADTLASSGYYVLAPNIFYRSHRAPVVDYGELLNPEKLPDLIKQVMAMAAVVTPDLAKSDVEGLLNFAKVQPQADSKKIGAVGYCMGGGQALRAAGNFPEDFSAVASFHAGNLATDAESSPHRWFKNIKAEVYIGHADQDQHMPAEQMKKVSAALDEAHLKYKAELYQGSRHGWTMSDLPAYNKEGEQKHWIQLLDLFHRALQAT